MSKQNTGYEVEYMDISLIGKAIFLGKSVKKKRMKIASEKYNLHYALDIKGGARIKREGSTRSVDVRRLDSYDKAVYDAVTTIYRNKEETRQKKVFTVSLLCRAMYGYAEKNLTNSERERIVDSLNVMSQIQLVIDAERAYSEKGIPRDGFKRGLLLPIKPVANENKDIDFKKYEFTDKPPLLEYDEENNYYVSVKKELFGTPSDFKIERRGAQGDYKNLPNDENTLLIKRYLISRLEKMRIMKNQNSRISFDYEGPKSRRQGLINDIGKSFKNEKEMQTYVAITESILNYFKEIGYINDYEKVGSSTDIAIDIVPFDDKELVKVSRYLNY